MLMDSPYPRSIKTFVSEVNILFKNRIIVFIIGEVLDIIESGDVLFRIVS